MTVYLSKLVAADDRAMAAQRLRAANDRGLPRKIHPLFAHRSNDRLNTSARKAEPHDAPLVLDNNEPSPTPDIRRLGYVGAAVFLVALICIGALLPYI